MFRTSYCVWSGEEEDKKTVAHILSNVVIFRVVVVSLISTLFCDAVENKEHSDFLLLRQMMIQTHMQDLKDITQEIHYENFRKMKLMETDKSVK